MNEPETYTIKLERVLTDAEFEQIYRQTFPSFQPFDEAQKFCAQTIMCAAIKFDRAKCEKDTRFSD